MKRKLMLGGLLALALSVSSVSAFAKNTDAVSLTGGTAFAEQRSKVETDLADGVTYVEISAENREKVLRALERIQHEVSRAGSLDALSPDAKVTVFNEQEVVNTILTKARDDSRVICRRETTVGTRFKRGSCNTVAELARRREATQDGLNSHQLGLLESGFAGGSGGPK